jgi:hypothetical protein
MERRQNRIRVDPNLRQEFKLALMIGASQSIGWILQLAPDDLRI